MIAGAIAFVILLGGFGGIFFDRVVFPYLSTLTPFRGVEFFRGNAPLVINRREEIRIDEGLNQAELAQRSRSSLVTVYVHEGAFRSGQFRVLGYRTGIVVSADGLIAAPFGGLLGSGVQYTVITGAGEVRSAEIAATDRFTGLFLLKVDDISLPVARQGAGRSAEAGEKVLALWVPEGAGSLALAGATVSEPAGERTGFGQIYDFNSPAAVLSLDRQSVAEGAAVIDKDGQLLGVAVSSGGKAEILPSEYLKLLLDNYLDDRVVTWPGWRVSYSVFGPAQIALFGLSGRYGVLIKSAGGTLRADDFVYQVDGSALSADAPFQTTLLSKKPGTKVRFSIIRDGVEKEVEVQL